MHDFVVNHRTEGTSPRLTQDTCPTRLYRHAPAVSPIKAEGNQCGLEKRRAGNIEKLRMIRRFIDRQMALRFWRFLETSEEVRVSGEV